MAIVGGGGGGGGTAILAPYEEPSVENFRIAWPLAVAVTSCDLRD